MDSPYAKIREITEEDGNGKLHKLNRMVLFSQKQDLNQNKDTVHENCGGSDRQRGEQADHIGNAGNWRSAEVCFDGTCDAKGHDGETGQKNQVSLQQRSM